MWFTPLHGPLAFTAVSQRTTEPVFPLKVMVLPLLPEQTVAAEAAIVPPTEVGSDFTLKIDEVSVGHTPDLLTNRYQVSTAWLVIPRVSVVILNEVQFEPELLELSQLVAAPDTPVVLSVNELPDAQALVLPLMVPATLVGSMVNVLVLEYC